MLGRVHIGVGPILNCNITMKLSFIYQEKLGEKHNNLPIFLDVHAQVQQTPSTQEKRFNPWLIIDAQNVQPDYCWQGLGTQGSVCSYCVNCGHRCWHFCHVLPTLTGYVARGILFEQS